MRPELLALILDREQSMHFKYRWNARKKHMRCERFDEATVAQLSDYLGYLLTQRRSTITLSEAGNE